MWMRITSGILLGSSLLTGSDIHGTIQIERKLTRHNVTPSVGLYQRGASVELGEDPVGDPLGFERSHVAVYIESGPGVPASARTKATIEQRDRRFAPDLVVVPAGSTVSFPNFDPIFHNVFSLSKPKSFDLGNYPKGQTREVTFGTAGVVAVYCHLHSNMSATILVSPTQWVARADSEGAFTLKGVPSGSYTVVAWHKAAGTFRRKVTVVEGKPLEISFTLPYVEPSIEKESHHK